MTTQLISHRPSARSPAVRVTVSADGGQSRRGDRADSLGLASMDGEEVENRLASLNRRYETAADAAAEAGAEYRFLRGSHLTSTAAIETQRRRWIQLEHWRQDVDAAIERLENFVTELGC